MNIVMLKLENLYKFFENNKDYDKVQLSEEELNSRYIDPTQPFREKLSKSFHKEAEPKSLDTQAEFNEVFNKYVDPTQKYREAFSNFVTKIHDKFFESEHQKLIKDINKGLNQCLTGKLKL